MKKGPPTHSVLTGLPTFLPHFLPLLAYMSINVLIRYNEIGPIVKWNGSHILANELLN